MAVLRRAERLDWPDTVVAEKSWNPWARKAGMAVGKAFPLVGAAVADAPHLRGDPPRVCQNPDRRRASQKWGRYPHGCVGLRAPPHQIVRECQLPVLGLSTAQDP